MLEGGGHSVLARSFPLLRNWLRRFLPPYISHEGFHSFSFLRLHSSVQNGRTLTRMHIVIARATRDLTTRTGHEIPRHPIPNISARLSLRLRPHRYIQPFRNTRPTLRLYCPSRHSFFCLNQRYAYFFNFVHASAYYFLLRSMVVVRPYLDHALGPRLNGWIVKFEHHVSDCDVLQYPSYLTTAPLPPVVWLDAIRFRLLLDLLIAPLKWASLPSPLAMTCFLTSSCCAKKNPFPRATIC